MLPFELTKDTPYLALSGELWSVFYEYFNRNWPCYKGFLLYDGNINHWRLGMTQQSTHISLGMWLLIQVSPCLYNWPLHDFSWRGHVNCEIIRAAMPFLIVPLLLMIAFMGTARYSEWSLVRRFVGPKIVHWSKWSKVRQVGSPKGHWSENRSIGPNGQ